MAYEIVVPRLGWSMEEGTFAGWLKQDGQFVNRGDALFALEGEKAIQDVEAVDQGILHIPPTSPASGCVVKVGAVIGYLAAQGELIPDGNLPSSMDSDKKPSALPETRQLQTQASAQVSPLPAVPSPIFNSNPIASPSVRRRAKELSVDLTTVLGTGPGGRITSGDVAQVVSSPRLAITAITNTAGVSQRRTVSPTDAQAVVASPRARRVAKELNVDWTLLVGTGAAGRVRERDVRASQHSAMKLQPISSRRKIIAERLMHSRQQTVPVTLTTRADATQLVALRERMKASLEVGTTPSYQDILIKLVSQCLLSHRSVASRWEQGGIAMPDESKLDIGIAVDTDDGLLVPVIRNTASLSIAEIADQSRMQIERARNNSLTASEMHGAVFTITNLGAFGIDAFTPVINLPQCAILGLGAIRTEPVAMPDGSLAVRPQITLNLTFDHRVLDGAPAARFLQELVQRIGQAIVG